MTKQHHLPQQPSFPSRALHSIILHLVSGQFASSDCSSQADSDHTAATTHQRVNALVRQVVISRCVVFDQLSILDLVTLANLVDLKSQEFLLSKQKAGERARHQPKHKQFSTGLEKNACCTLETGGHTRILLLSKRNRPQLPPPILHSNRVKPPKQKPLCYSFTSCSE